MRRSAAPHSRRLLKQQGALRLQCGRCCWGQRPASSAVAALHRKGFLILSFIFFLSPVGGQNVQEMMSREMGVKVSRDSGDGEDTKDCVCKRCVTTGDRDCQPHREDCEGRRGRENPAVSPLLCLVFFHRQIQTFINLNLKSF